MKKGTKELALVNADVPDVLALLDEELKNLKTITDKPYRTTGNLENFGDIKVETKVENLIRAFSMVRGKEDAYNKAAKELEIATYPVFQISGGSADDWKQDIQLRMNVIEHDSRKNKLAEYKEKMSKFLSEADQREMLLKEMAAFLKSK